MSVRDVRWSSAPPPARPPLRARATRRRGTSRLSEQRARAPVPAVALAPRRPPLSVRRTLSRPTRRRLYRRRRASCARDRRAVEGPDGGVPALRVGARVGDRPRGEPRHAPRAAAAARGGEPGAPSGGAPPARRRRRARRAPSLLPARPARRARAPARTFSSSRAARTPSAAIMGASQATRTPRTPLAASRTVLSDARHDPSRSSVAPPAATLAFSAPASSSAQRTSTAPAFATRTGCGGVVVSAGFGFSASRSASFLSFLDELGLEDRGFLAQLPRLARGSWRPPCYAFAENGTQRARKP